MPNTRPPPRILCPDNLNLDAQTSRYTATQSPTQSASTIPKKSSGSSRMCPSPEARHFVPKRLTGKTTTRRETELDESLAHPPLVLLEQHAAQLGEGIGGRIVEGTKNLLPLGNRKADNDGSELERSRAAIARAHRKSREREDA